MAERGGGVGLILQAIVPSRRRRIPILLNQPTVVGHQTHPSVQMMMPHEERKRRNGDLDDKLIDGLLQRDYSWKKRNTAAIRCRFSFHTANPHPPFISPPHPSSFPTQKKKKEKYCTTVNPVDPDCTVLVVSTI